jgi:hypothetical protein
VVSHYFFALRLRSSSARRASAIVRARFVTDGISAFFLPAMFLPFPPQFAGMSHYFFALLALFITGLPMRFDAAFAAA